jgi:hypothetical protein
MSGGAAQGWVGSAFWRRNAGSWAQNSRRGRDGNAAINPSIPCTPGFLIQGSTTDVPS